MVSITEEQIDFCMLIPTNFKVRSHALSNKTNKTKFGVLVVPNLADFVIRGSNV